MFPTNRSSGLRRSMWKDHRSPLPQGSSWKAALLPGGLLGFPVAEENKAQNRIKWVF